MIQTFARRCLCILLAAAPAGTALGQCTPAFTDGPDLFLPSAFAIALGDVDGDGQLDIVAGRNAPGGALSVFLNTGGGTFGPRVDFGSVPEMRHLILADLNADGMPDAVATTNTSLEIFLNLGSGAFAAPASYPIGALCRQSAAADMDNDGDLDVVFASGTPGATIELFRNNGAGVLTRNSMAVPAAPNAVYIEDFTQDGWPDVVLGGASNLGIYTLQNDGAGNLMPAELIASNVGGNAFAAGDLNGDGLVDLITMAPNHARCHILMNQSFGFFPPITFINTSSTGFQWQPAIADLTGDGVPEVILPFGNRVNIYEQTSPFNFGIPIQHFTGGNTGHVVVADINGDGSPDMVVTNPNSGTVRPIFNTWSVSITQHPTAQTTHFGGEASFSVVAATTGPGTTYQWRRNGVNLAEGGHYAGVNAATLTITQATGIEAGTYDCVVSSCGSATSGGAVLTVTPCPSSDFDGDGDIGTDADIEAFFRVLAGGGC